MYRVRFYTGDYRVRQQQANADGCAGYVEHHFNSAGPTADYACVVVGSNASQASRNWGRWYAQAVAREFAVGVGGDQGIFVGGFEGRGDANLRYTSMPAVLLEPLFASNPRHAEWIRNVDGQRRLARILCESIRRFFQSGGLIGFSVGHKYKTSMPYDRGAAVVGGGAEADFAEAVLQEAERMLLTSTPPIPQPVGPVVAPSAGRTLRVMRGDAVLWTTDVDEDAVVTWDGTRGLLDIRG